MRKSLLLMGVAILTFSSSTGAVVIRAGDDGTNTVFLAPETNQVVEIFAAGDGSAAFIAIGAIVKATIGDGNGPNADPDFTSINFGAPTTVDPGDGLPLEDAVLWHPDEPNSAAWDIPVFDQKQVDAGVAWVDSVKETALPTGPSPSDLSSQTLIVELELDASAFSGSTIDSVTTFELDLNGSVLVGPSPGTPGATNPTGGTPVNAMLMIALGGDANLDGRVSGGDLAILSANFGQSGTSWTTGDFNKSGTNSGGDLAILSFNFGQTLVAEAAPAPAPTAVPEPSSAAALMVLVGFLAGRRRRK